MKSLHSILKETGLNDKQATVYLTLLELNEGLPSAIARKSGLKRPTVYVVLDTLMEKGLVSRVRRKGSTFFRAIEPTALYEDQHRKLESLRAAVPELVTLHQRFQTNPQMVIFEGTEGIIQVMEDTLNAEGEILCWSNVDQAVNTILADYHPRYLKKKIKNKIITKCLFLYDEPAFRMKMNAKKEFREVFFLPKDKFPFENEINVYNDKMSIISHKDQVGVIIQNQAIADTQRAIFNFGFEYAQSLEKEILSPEHLAELGLS